MSAHALHEQVLLLEAAGSVYALKIADVAETLRPLKLQVLPDVPHFVMGAAVIRGVAAPVADLSALLSGRSGSNRRWISIRCKGRPAILSVDHVRGVGSLASSDAQQLPAMLDSSATPISALQVLDAGLLAVLDSGRLVPDSVWAAIRSQQEQTA